MKREELEAIALDACPAFLFYELGDGIESVSDADLLDIISENIPGTELS
jgi:hypothetical protein